jgi:hypothetical protein
VNYVPDENGPWNANSTKDLQDFIERQTFPELLGCCPNYARILDHMLADKNQNWRVEIFARPDENGLSNRETLDPLEDRMYWVATASDLFKEVRALRALDKEIAAAFWESKQNREIQSSKRRQMPLRTRYRNPARPQPKWRLVTRLLGLPQVPVPKIKREISLQSFYRCTAGSQRPREFRSYVIQRRVLVPFASTKRVHWCYVYDFSFANGVQIGEPVYQKD